MENKELYTQFDNVFFEKSRLSIMTILYKEERASFNWLKAILKSTDGAIYSHLQKLLKNGYIGEIKEITGNNLQTFYNLTDNGKNVFKEYISFLENLVQGK